MFVTHKNSEFDALDTSFSQLIVDTKSKALYCFKIHYHEVLNALTVFLNSEKSNKVFRQFYLEFYCFDLNNNYSCSFLNLTVISYTLI